MRSGFWYASRLLLVTVCFVGVSPDVGAQSPEAAEPIVGLRSNPPQGFALTNADVVVRPGKVVSDATVLIHGTSIHAVGNQEQPPAGYKVIDCSGKRIYAGLIDAFSEIDVPLPQESNGGYWNRNVVIEREASSVAAHQVGQSKSEREKLRSQGITIRMVAPRGGIIKGSGSVVLLGESDAGRNLLKEKAWQHAQLTVPRTGNRPRYPNSPMGAVALLRQAMYDAIWYREAWAAYRADTSLTRPETNRALERLSAAIDQDTFVLDAPNERMAIRAGKIAQEFALNWILRGSGREYQRLDEIASMGRPVLVPLSFPKTPDVKSPEGAERVSLRDLMHWDLAPENPGRLVESGLPICLTTDGLEKVDDFLKQVRRAVRGGLKADDALAALTTTPASLLGLDDVCGTVQSGRLANLLVVDGDLFETETKVLETWVAGERFLLADDQDEIAKSWAGTWSIHLDVAEQSLPMEIRLDWKKGKMTGSIRMEGAAFESEKDPPSSDAETPAKEEEDESEEESDAAQRKESTKLEDLTIQRDQITASMQLNKIRDEWIHGKTRLVLVNMRANPKRSKQVAPEVFATVWYPDGKREEIEVHRLERAESDDSEEDEEKPAGEVSNSETDSSGEVADSKTSSASDIASGNQPSTPVLYPLGAYGLEQPKQETPTVLFQGATVWTCDDRGVIPDGDVLIRDGKILEIGTGLSPPPNCRVIDARGKHLTPGLIDCHSHVATDGGVNESGQAVTAEVRIGDFIDNTDISIYRQLAGGVTTSNILHGSANPIGGQNQVIKFRWGDSMDGLRMQEAPPGIKFALGENVKRSRTRYPNSRMGVEQILKDQFLAAREYDAAWRRWNRGERGSLPPRTDLQLQAMAEIQRGERWVHCHSYRQDEILATMEVLEEFGIQIGTFQHILEGYKVADRMARHGAMGSSFSDWWAYKFEVFDAIAHNGALMHEQGVVVSFNSDDAELARHLNTEAAKATKYGGVPEEEALKFVTLNPAKQLRIETLVGSIAEGKHADLVLWSGRPLSTLSRCEQTWVDGRCYFDRETDRKMQDRDKKLRAALVQKALGADDGGSGSKEETSEEDRWDRFDAFCGASVGVAGQRNGTTSQSGQLQQDSQRGNRR